jgi:hypothetical protein
MDTSNTDIEDEELGKVPKNKRHATFVVHGETVTVRMTIYNYILQRTAITNLSLIIQ